MLNYQQIIISRSFRKQIGRSHNSHEWWLPWSIFRMKQSIVPCSKIPFWDFNVFLPRWAMAVVVQTKQYFVSNAMFDVYFRIRKQWRPKSIEHDVWLLQHVVSMQHTVAMGTHGVLQSAAKLFTRNHLDWVGSAGAVQRTRLDSDLFSFVLRHNHINHEIILLMITWNFSRNSISSVFAASHIVEKKLKTESTDVMLLSFPTCST